MRPGDLLAPDSALRLAETLDVPVDPDRVARLIARGAALALAVESWSNKGLWVVSRSDPGYPQRIKARLGRSAPPVLYGAGDCSLLAGGGLAVVGSRDVDEPALAFTRRVATICGEQGIQVISGAARGVDSEAMQAVLAAGGTAVAVLADSLLKAAVAGKHRQALRAGRLALVTAYEPEVGFSVGNAMGRNKSLYASSDYALVVSTSLGEGGTWSGATENLAGRWVPLFVRSEGSIPLGNRRLLEMGGFPLDEAALAGQVSLSDTLARRAGGVLPLAEPDRGAPEPLTDAPPMEASDALVNGFPAPGVSVSLPAPEPAALLPEESSGAPKTSDLFDVIWPYFERELQTPRTERDLADLFHIEITQARAWLQRAVKDGRVVKLARPVRYVAASRQPQATMPLL
jgi:predicted Rossmann fold nucleotide-binding protein DprA/Smf involved in DNA uptake